MKATKTAINRRHFLSAALGATLLSGCGFHLRGEMTMPFKSIHIAGWEHHALIADLRRRLRLNNVEVLDTPDDAEVILRITRLAPEREILSLDASGKAREYRLFYYLGYALDSADGRTLRAPERIVVRREYTYDSGQVLAKTQEESLLYSDMEKDLVTQLIRRLSATDLSAKPAG